LQSVLVSMIENRFLYQIILLCLAVTVLLTACSTVEAALGTPTPIPSGEYIFYMTQPGDTIAQIAKQFQLTIEQLIALNNDRYPALARDPSLLQPGWQIKVPSKNASVAARATAEAMQSPFDMTEATGRTIEEVNAARARQGLVTLKSDLVRI
jgi:spore germination protein YaaH